MSSIVGGVQYRFDAKRMLIFEFVRFMDAQFAILSQ